MWEQAAVEGSGRTSSTEPINLSPCYLIVLRFIEFFIISELVRLALLASSTMHESGDGVEAARLFFTFMSWVAYSVTLLAIKAINSSNACELIVWAYARRSLPFKTKRRTFSNSSKRENCRRRMQNLTIKTFTFSILNKFLTSQPWKVPRILMQQLDVSLSDLTFPLLSPL